MNSTKRARKRQGAGGNGSGKPKATLDRTTFQTSRLLDFCSEKELTAQTGHDPDDWPLVVLKELMDNALDACEEVGVPPEITVEVKENVITVRDNAGGMPPETVDGVLDYSVRVSSREAYVAPDRGAQGNALKTILAMPFVLHGELGRVDITAKGQRHEITFAVNPIRQQPLVTREIRASRMQTGTKIAVHWPSVCRQNLDDAKVRFLQLADDYTFLNPHLRLVLKWSDYLAETVPTNPEWSKWRPSDPTCPHWYSQEDFERLISAYLTHDEDQNRERSVREFVREFRGLTGTSKQKKVLAATRFARSKLFALANGESLRHDAVAALLEAIKQETKPVKPALLGIIGKDHIVARFAAAGCDMETFDYKKATEVDENNIPVVLETAFAWRGDNCDEGRRLITGVNWSAGIVNPFRELGASYGDGLAALLEKQRAGGDEPVVFLLHAACPRVRYTDRGKSAVVIE